MRLLVRHSLVLECHCEVACHTSYDVSMVDAYEKISGCIVHPCTPHTMHPCDEIIKNMTFTK